MPDSKVTSVSGITIGLNAGTLITAVPCMSLLGLKPGFLLPTFPKYKVTEPPVTISKKKITAAKAPKDKFISGDDIPESEYLDDIGTPMKFSIRSAINVNSYEWIKNFEVDNINPNNTLLPIRTSNIFLPDNTKNKGQYLSNDTTLKDPGSTKVTFIDGSIHFHKGASYIEKNKKLIPQNGEQSGLLFIIKNI